MFKVFSHDENTIATFAEFKFLHYKCDFWEFPKQDDIQIIDLKFIYLGPCIPAETCKKCYRFSEDNKALEMFKAFKNEQFEK